jgi:D-arabinose 1-dehydrogenase-like Zn-dependent alcohol dehydrogenase
VDTDANPRQDSSPFDSRSPARPGCRPRPTCQHTAGGKRKQRGTPIHHAVFDLVNRNDAIRHDAEVLKPGGALVSTQYAAHESWFAERRITATNISSITNPLSSPQGLEQLAHMLAHGTITARIHSTVDLDDAPQMLEQLRHGSLRGKAVIRL